MKQTYGLGLFLGFLFTIVSIDTSAKTVNNETSITEGQQIKTLIINANVSIGLVANSKSSLEVIGGNYIKKTYFILAKRRVPGDWFNKK